MLVTIYSFATESDAVEISKQPEILVGEWVQESPHKWHKYIYVDEMPPVKITLVIVDTITKDVHQDKVTYPEYPQSKVVAETPCEEMEGGVDTLTWYAGDQEGDLVLCTGTAKKLRVQTVQNLIGTYPR